MPRVRWTIFGIAGLGFERTRGVVRVLMLDRDETAHPGRGIHNADELLAHLKASTTHEISIAYGTGAFVEQLHQYVPTLRATRLATFRVQHAVRHAVRRAIMQCAVQHFNMPYSMPCSMRCSILRSMLCSISMQLCSVPCSRAACCAACHAGFGVACRAIRRAHRYWRSDIVLGVWGAGLANVVRSLG